MIDKTKYSGYECILYQMLRIRMIEEAIAERYPQQQMRCPTHLSIGQEGVSALIGHFLTSADKAVSTHRAHGHFLAKGGDLNAFIAELYGKKTGCTRGRGGSMNLSDLNAGFIASTAIVGNTVPIGVGLGFSQQLKKTNAISCVFIGDAAIEEGVVYESINFAVLKKLPVLFICENNLYSVYTPLEERQPKGREIFKLAEAIGANTAKYDGNDVFPLIDTIGQQIERLRQGEGPLFLEFSTYRYKVHCGYEDDLGGVTRPKSEIDYWMARDPIDLFKKHLLDTTNFTESTLTDMKNAIESEIKMAFDFAISSEFPHESEAKQFLYKENSLAWLNELLESTNKEGVYS